MDTGCITPQRGGKYHRKDDTQRGKRGDHQKGVFGGYGSLKSLPATTKSQPKLDLQSGVARGTLFNINSSRNRKDVSETSSSKVLFFSEQLKNNHLKHQDEDPSIALDFHVWLSAILKNILDKNQKTIFFLFDCIKVAVFVFLFLFIHVKVNAQTLEEQRLRSKSPWNFLNDFTVDTNSQLENSIDNSSGVTYTSGFRYSLGAQRNLWVFGRLAKRFTGEERFDMLDTIVRLEQALDPKFLGMSMRLRGDLILPTNDFIREQTSFVGATGGQLRFTKSLPYNLFFIWSNNFRWNFHDYRVSELGIPNVQTTASASGLLSYSVSPRLQTSLTLGWSVAKTYENIFKDFYSIDINASYTFTKEWSALFGWTTAGSPFTADGRSSNIRLFDERDTTFYLSVTHFM